jgi:hypothetical protein
MTQHDPFIENEMKRLNEIKSMVEKTSGMERETWTKKWYKVVKIVADKINVLQNGNSRKCKCKTKESSRTKESTWR